MTTEWLMLRPFPYAMDVYRDGLCSSGYSYEKVGRYRALKALIRKHPNYEAEVSEWGEGYRRIAPFFLVRWEDDQEV